MQANVYQAEIEEIRKHCWLESERAGCNVGEEWAALDWTERYAEQFRAWWGLKPLGVKTQGIKT